MRDLDRWKDKVELQLDGRQIFFLFFGSAICACLIFVLGVVVGKRMEAHAAAQVQSPAEDPLAALDELGSTEEGLTFHSALTEKRDVRRPRAAHDDGKEGAREAVKETGAEGQKDGKQEAAVVAPVVAEESSPVKAQEEGKAEARDEGKGEDKAERKPAADSAAAIKARLAEAKVVSKDGKGTDLKGKNHFTLQLSAFATKAEASEFLRRLRDAGYKPFLAESLVPGKGLMYRVRLGDYVSRESALSAKGDFERKQKMVAYVAKL